MSVIIVNDTEVESVINNLLDSSLRKRLLKEVGSVMVNDAKLNFRAKKSPDGEAWTPSKRGGQTLSDTGVLKNSISYEATDEEVYIGTNVRYARIHNEGGVIKGKNGGFLKFKIGDKFIQKRKVEMPKREFLGVHSKQVKKINQAASRWIKSIIEGA